MPATFAPLWGRSPIDKSMAVTFPHTHTETNETESARRAGGPEDRALYLCACGAAFTAPVSTSVSCARCGDDQAW